MEEAAKTITADAKIDNAAVAIADPRVPDSPPLAIISDPKRSPWVPVEVPGKTPRSKPTTRHVEVPVVIVAADGTWHRPLSPLELAVIQDLPAVVRGEPLKLHGDNRSLWIERIGNAVPVGAAAAIAEQMLLSYLSSRYGAGLTLSGGQTWVGPEPERAMALG